MVRIPEHYDWVVFVLLGCIIIFIVMLQQLQRGSTVRDYMVQSNADSNNIFPSWLLVSLVHVVLLSTLISQFVPVVPQKIYNFSPFGYSLNKFGYTLGVLSLFYFAKAFFSYLYYAFVGQGKRFSKLFFAASKFYFALSIVLMIAVFIKYFTDINGLTLFQVIITAAVFAFTGKIAFFLLHRSEVLPKEWYYKFLYICTLQIAPMLALWQLLFF